MTETILTASWLSSAAFQVPLHTQLIMSPSNFHINDKSNMLMDNRIQPIQCKTIVHKTTVWIYLANHFKNKSHQDMDSKGNHFRRLGLHIQVDHGTNRHEQNIIDLIMELTNMDSKGNHFRWLGLHKLLTAHVYAQRSQSSTKSTVTSSQA